MIEDLLDEAELKMEHTIDHLRKELGKLRTGSASLALLEGLKVDYYGNATPLDQVGTLGLQDNQTIAFSAGVTFKKIEFRFTLDRKASGNATTPELHDFTFTCQLRANTIKQLPLSLYLANGLPLLNGLLENKAKTNRDQLRSWQAQAAEITLGMRLILLAMF